MTRFYYYFLLSFRILTLQLRKKGDYIDNCSGQEERRQQNINGPGKRDKPFKNDLVNCSDQPERSRGEQNELSRGCI